MIASRASKLSVTRLSWNLLIAGLCLLSVGCATHREPHAVRFASFNVSMHRDGPGVLAAELSEPGSDQPAAIAQIIQQVRPDVILLNEFDVDLSGQSARDFQAHYLGVGHGDGEPIRYDYVYVADSNTGVLTGHDLNNDGTIATRDDLGSGQYAGDAQGYGRFPGQYGFVIFSRYPIDTDNARTFQDFLWRDMPGNLLTDDKAPGENSLARFYSTEEIQTLRLSSKNHVDLPIRIGDRTVHVLAAHPTPPGFDGPELRNAKRNHDEIRLWADYISGHGYMTDDAGDAGGLGRSTMFVIMGDYNADPFDGSSIDGAIDQLLDHPRVIGSTTDPAVTPANPIGREQAQLQAGANTAHLGNPAFDTGDFGFRGAGQPDRAPGNLRVDYVLPSANLTYLHGEVVWPAVSDPVQGGAARPASDHRLVFVDVGLP